jgi:hypothetical protein
MKKYLLSECIFSITDGFTGNKSNLSAIRKCDNGWFIPIGMWNNVYSSFPKRKWATIQYPKFKVDLLTSATDEKKRDQDVVAKEAIKALRETNTVFFNIYTGFGKTCLGCWLTGQLKRKTLIVSHVGEALNAWMSEFQVFYGSTIKIQHVKGKTLDPKANVYVIGIQKAHNMTQLNPNVFTEIGTVIVDEAHVATETCFGELLQYTRPEFLIGLSASPDREDGLHSMFEKFFRHTIERFEKREKGFQVLKIETGIKPKLSYKPLFGQMKLDWRALEDSLYQNETRNSMICDKIVALSKKTVVFCKYKYHVEDLFARLQKRNSGKKIITYYGTVKRKDYEASADVVITTFKKLAAAFNDPTLKIVLFAADIKDVRQPNGRIRNTDKTVVDFVDDNSTLVKHWSAREDFYTMTGGHVTIEKIQ